VLCLNLNLLLGVSTRQIVLSVWGVRVQLKIEFLSSELFSFCYFCCVSWVVTEPQILLQWAYECGVNNTSLVWFSPSVWRGWRGIHGLGSSAIFLCFFPLAYFVQMERLEHVAVHFILFLMLCLIFGYPSLLDWVSENHLQAPVSF